MFSVPATGDRESPLINDLVAALFKRDTYLDHD